MKYFVVPAPIALLDPVTKKPLKYAKDHPQAGEDILVTAHRFVLDNICASKDIGKGVEAIRRIHKLDEALDGTAEGDIVGFEDADYAAMMAIVAAMEFQFPLHAAQLLPLFEALEAAAKQDDKWKKEQNREQAV